MTVGVSIAAFWCSTRVGLYAAGLSSVKAIKLSMKLESTELGHSTAPG